MKRIEFRAILHIYFIFFVVILGAILIATSVLYQLITIQMTNGIIHKSDWPKSFCDSFVDQIEFIDARPIVKQRGFELLQDNNIGLQIIDDSGSEILSFQKPNNTSDCYSKSDIVQLFTPGLSENADTTVFAGIVDNNKSDYVYILYFPINVSKITMYLNGDKFKGGKILILLLVVFLFLTISIVGVIYGYFTSRSMGVLIGSIREIAKRTYYPNKTQGTFSDVYESLNTLALEIENSDKLQDQTDKLRKEWIANITHDLKTPLSPIKGYTEILMKHNKIPEKDIKQYSQVMMKNVTYMETLIDDLKISYQLENSFIPLERQETNIIRFIKEILIDILNNPEYENRIIDIESVDELILFSFDHKLLSRAIQNIIINALVHGGENAEVKVQISSASGCLRIIVSDNGKGISQDELALLFQRYYRGTNTSEKVEGTGLGLTIAKSIIERHGGTISVESVLGLGTTFQLYFNLN